MLRIDMIKLQFQALENYQKTESDQQKAIGLMEDLQQKFPRLFEKEEVVMDMKVNQQSSGDKKVVLIGYIPKHGKIITQTKQRTFNQALSALKADLERTCRDVAHKAK